MIHGIQTKEWRHRPKWTVLAALCLFLPSARLACADKESSPPLSLSIRCLNKSIKVGDEIRIQFQIVNEGREPCSVVDRNYDRSGRMDEYELWARDENGVRVADPRRYDWLHGLVGGIDGETELAPGAALLKEAVLNRWALIRAPGKYQVSAKYDHRIVSEPIEIVVEPCSPQEMTKRIRSLETALEFARKALALAEKAKDPEKAKRKALQEAGEAICKLMYTCDSQVIPILADSLYWTDDSFWQTEAFFLYLNWEDVKAALVDAVIKRGLAPQMPSVLRILDFNNEQRKGLKRELLRIARSSPGLLMETLELLERLDASVEEMIPIIERLLTSSDPSEWIDGAAAAGSFWDDRFIPRLLAIVGDPRSEMTEPEARRGYARDGAKRWIVSALTYNPTEESIRALRSILAEADEPILRDSLYCLASAIEYKTPRQPMPPRAMELFEEMRARLLGYDKTPPELAVSLRCAGDAIRLGDEIPIEFTITNAAGEPCRILEPRLSCFVRAWSMRLTALNDSGVSVPDPLADKSKFDLRRETLMDIGGGKEIVELAPGGQFQRTLLLNSYALIREPGTYEVTGIFHPMSARQVQSEPIRITVAPRTPEEMNAYVDELARSLSAIREDATKRTEIVRKLALSGAPQAVDILLESQDYWGITAFPCYFPSPEDMKRRILEELEKKDARSLFCSPKIASLLRACDVPVDEVHPYIQRQMASDDPNERFWAIDAAGNLGDTGSVDALIDIATDPTTEVPGHLRLPAIRALALCRTDKSVETLKKLLQDPDGMIRYATRDAILQSYFNPYIASRRPLREDDFPDIFGESQRGP